MTIEELKAEAETELTEAIETIEETGTLHQQFILIHANGKRGIVFCDGTVSNDEDAKRALALKIRIMIATQDVVAVIMVSDVFQAVLSPEADAIRKRDGLTISQLGERGLADVTQAVIVTIESPIYAAVTRQNYTRDDAGRKITLGARHDAAEGEGGLGRIDGRFLSFFLKQRQAAHAS